MSIVGIGCDILHIIRIKNILNQFGKKFIKRILSSTECYEFMLTKHKENFLAKRFAVKEALFKSLGSGIRNEIKFRHFELSHNKFGKPSLVFLKHTKKILIKKNIVSIHVSLSDEKEYIFAVVILEN